MRALADNVLRLKERRGWSLAALARRAGVSKSALGYLVNWSDPNDRHATMETVEAIARAFEIEAWQLMVPDSPIELLESKRFRTMIENYRAAPDAGKLQIERVAESEIRYAIVKDKPEPEQKAS